MLLDRVNRNDIGVIDCRRCPGLANKAAASRGLLAKSRDITLIATVRSSCSSLARNTTPMPP